jgi:pimeloyl-ACP methyl ester carboxylesterase
MGLAGPVPSLDALAGRLVAELGEGPVVLIGHSQSCQVVAAAADDVRVVAVVLLGPTTDPRLRAVVGLVRQWLRTAVHEPVRSVPRILAQWWTTGPRAMAALWRNAAPDRIERRLAGVRVSVVVVRGTRDRLCPHDWAVRVAAAAPRGRLVEIPGAAHMTPQTHPDDVFAVILSAPSGGI